MRFTFNVIALAGAFNALATGAKSGRFKDLPCLANSATVHKGEHQIVQAVHFPVDFRAEIGQALQIGSVLRLDQTTSELGFPWSCAIFLANFFEDRNGRLQIVLDNVNL